MPSFTSLLLKISGSVLGAVTFFGVMVVATLLGYGMQQTSHGDAVIAPESLLLFILVFAVLLLWASFRGWHGIHWVNRIFLFVPALYISAVILKQALILQASYSVIRARASEFGPLMVKESNEFTFFGHFLDVHVWFPLLVVSCLAYGFFLFVDSARKVASQSEAFMASFGVAFLLLLLLIGIAWVEVLVSVAYVETNKLLIFRIADYGIDILAFLLKVMILHIQMSLAYALWQVRASPAEPASFKQGEHHA